MSQWADWLLADASAYRYYLRVGRLADAAFYELECRRRAAYLIAGVTVA